MQGFNNPSRIARIVAAALVGLAIGAGGAQAYPIYDDPEIPGDDNCAFCHGDQNGSTAWHQQHLNNLDIKLSPLAPQFASRCNVCHPAGGGSVPVFTMGSNHVNGGGLGCAGCHGQDYGETVESDHLTYSFMGNPKASGWGLRQVHEDAAVFTCQGCHGLNPFPVLDESVNPPYYALQISRLRNACDSNQEDLTLDVDLVGLDNDGNGFADYPDDPNCNTTTTTTSTTNTTTTTLPPVTCGASPAIGCTPAAKAKVLVLEKAAGKEKMKFQLVKLVPAVVQADFGSPVAGNTSYALCLYDSADLLAASWEVARAGATCVGKPCWEDFKGIGFKYADKDATADGIAKMQLVGGDAGKGKVKMLGNNKSFALPTGIAAALSGETSATAQLLSSDGDCFGMALPTVKKADGLTFSAAAP